MSVELRLIGNPGDVAAALVALGAVADVAPGRPKPSRDNDGRVIQYAILTITPTGKSPTADD